MAENAPLPGRVKRLYRRLTGYFRAVFDPTLNRRVRIISGAKGLAALGVVGLALLCAYAVILIPFTPSISDIRKAKIDQPSVLISSDGKRLTRPGSGAFSATIVPKVFRQRVAIHAVQSS